MFVMAKPASSKKELPDRTALYQASITTCFSSFIASNHALDALGLGLVRVPHTEISYTMGIRLRPVSVSE